MTRLAVGSQHLKLPIDRSAWWRTGREAGPRGHSSAPSNLGLFLCNSSTTVLIRHVKSNHTLLLKSILASVKGVSPVSHPHTSETTKTSPSPCRRATARILMQKGSRFRRPGAGGRLIRAYLVSGGRFKDSRQHANTFKLYPAEV